MPRITWTDLPDDVRSFVENALGSPVVQASPAAGGFSPGTADRVTCADGTRAFIKAVSPAQNPDSPRFYRRELEIMRRMPAHVPVARLLAGLDHAQTGDERGWVVLVMADIDGHLPAVPWQADELDATLRALDELHAATTPCEIPGLPSVVDDFAQLTTAWDEWLTQPPADLDPWIAARLPELVERRHRALRDLEGDTLCHHDLRHDNVLIRPDGSAVIIDWPNASTGAPWYDASGLALELFVHPSVDPNAFLDRVADDHGVSREVLDDNLVTLLAYFDSRWRLPAPPGLPTLRGYQKRQADGILAWAQERWPD